MVKNIVDNIFNKDNFIKNYFILNNINVKMIILYIISFFVSITSFGEILNPLSIAILGAFCSLNIPVGILVIISTIGTYIRFGAIDSIIYIITAALFIITIMIARPQKIVGNEENEKLRVSKYLVFSCIGIQILNLFVQGMMVYDVLQAVLYIVMVFVFYKVFVNSIVVIKEYGAKKVFTIEEIVGISLIIAIVFSGIGSLGFVGIAIRNILCILLVMVLGWQNGVLLGTTIGVITGVTIGLISGEEPMLIAFYAFSGFLAGLLSKLGKVGVIVGFMLGNLILTYISNGNTVAILHLREVFIASLGLLLIPKKVGIKLNDIIGNKALFQVNQERLLDENKDAVFKLNSFSETLTELAKTYEESEEVKFKLEKENQEDFFKEVFNNIQDAKTNLIYEDIISIENNILRDVYIELCHKNEIDFYTFIKIFEKNNRYIVNAETDKNIKRNIEVILKVVNYTYQISKMNFIWKQKLVQSRKSVSNELAGVSKVIDTIAEELENSNINKNCENKIEDVFRKNNIKLNGIKINRETNQKNNIKLYFLKTDEVPNKIILEKLLSMILKEKIKYEKTEIIENKLIMLKFASKDKYMMQVGVAESKKNGNDISGDSYIKVKLEDGKYLVAISDGMGSGREAKKSSETAINMLEKLLKQGFEKNASINLINTTMNLNNSEEIFATLDITILDLFNGTVEFIKNASPQTFVKNKNEVMEINSTSLPAGIIENINLIVYEKDIEENDLIIMCTDGMIDSRKEEVNKGDWIKKTIENISTINVQKIADVLLSEAKDNYVGIPKDDMTVIVLKIIKK